MQLKISTIPSPLFLYYFPPWLDLEHFHLLKRNLVAYALIPQREREDNNQTLLSFKVNLY